MQKCLDIALSIQNHNQVHVYLQGNGMAIGECQEMTSLPFDTNDAAVLLRALEINRAVQETFDQKEWELLKQWGIVTGTFEGQEGEMELTEQEIQIAPLLDLVQQKLYHTLFPSEKCRKMLDRALNEIPSGTALHIRLKLPSGESGQSDNIQLFQFPWEVLSYQCPDYFSGRRVAFSRYIHSEYQVNELELTKKLNILVVRSLPEGLEYGAGSDSESIRKGLHGHTAEYWISVKELEQQSSSNRGTKQQLSEYLSHYNNSLDVPHILHLECHGKFGRRCSSGEHVEDRSSETECRCGAQLPPRFYGYLAFEAPKSNNSSGNGIHWIRADELADSLLDQQLKLVFINACSSALGRRGENIFNGVAQSLIQRGIPAVVATSFRIDWEAAMLFAQYFYQRIGQGDTLVEAIDRTRQDLISFPGISREWYRPVLYLRQQDNSGGRLFSEQHQANRSKQELAGEDFRGQNLRGYNFNQANLRGADLSHADLSGADLRNANLSEANLSHANLSGSNLMGAVLTKTKLHHVIIIDTTQIEEKWRIVCKLHQGVTDLNLLNANLSEADLAGVDLSRTDLTGANLRKADLTGADLNEANLTAANLTEATLNSAQLINAILIGADLSRADLCDANLSGANLATAMLSLVDLSGANLTGADLSRANSKGVDLSLADLIATDSRDQTSFRKTNLSRTNLTDANLNKAFLKGVNLRDSILCNAKLTRTNLSEADLSNANLDQADLTEVRLTYSKLVGIDFRTTLNVQKAKFSGADLSRTNFFKVDLTGPMDLSEVNLTDADLRGVNLNSVNLTNANLDGADLNGSNLDRANLTNANLRRANMLGVNVTENTKLDNKWRMTWILLNTSERPNLREKDLSGTKLTKVILAGADLRGADLRDSDLTEVDLTGADLTGANLTLANLAGADLTGANLAGTNLRGITIDNNTNLDTKWQLVWQIQNKPVENLDLRSKDLKDAELREVNLSNVDLTNTDLTGANLEAANLKEAILKEVNLTKTNLKQADLSGADLSRANFRETIIYRKVISDDGQEVVEQRTKLDDKWYIVWKILNEIQKAKRENLRGADLSHTDLRGIDLSGVKLMGADLSGSDLREIKLAEADLRGVNLSGSNLGQAHLEGANLRGADLYKADLRGADLSKTNLSRADLRGANLDEANLRDANLSEADLRGTSLNKADLSSTILFGANLNGVDLNQALIPKQVGLRSLFSYYKNLKITNSYLIESLTKRKVKQ